jgi:hypothetical protein
MTDTQACNKCNVIKHLSDFHRQSSRLNGHRCTCKLCRQPEIVANRVNGEERIRKASREWRRRNSESINVTRRENVKNDPALSEKTRASLSKWKKLNKAKVNAATAQRRAARIRATVLWSDKAAIDLVYAKSQRLSVWHQLEFHVDHMVPLTSDSVCGLHCEANLQILKAGTNIAKGNKHWPDMWEEL